MRGRRLHPGHQAATVLSLAVVAAVAGAGCRRSARLPPRPDGAAVVVAPEPTTESGFTMVEEVEPNDLLATAQEVLPTVAAGVGIMGRLVSAPGSKARDVDLYKVTIPAPAVVIAGPDGAMPLGRQRLVIEAHPDPGLAISVDALDGDGKVLVASIGSTPGEIEGIPNLAVLPGIFFVRVKPGGAGAAAGAASAAAGRRDAGAGAGGAGGYRLTLKLVPFEAGDEIEPNGKAILAGDVAADGDIAGFLGWRHDEDWFRLSLPSLPEGSVLSADLDPLEGVSASLAVYDSVEHKMIEQRGHKNDRVALRNVRLPSSDPNVFVVVTAESGRNLDTRYTLHLRTEEAKADAELEPNDDPAHAVPLADGTFVGTLGPGDVDVYRYTAAAPVELDFEVVPPDHVDVKIEVLRDDGSVITKVDVGKRKEPEHIPNLYVAGTVLLRLSARKGDGNLDEPYRITASSRPIEPGAEHEPNGTVALATALPAGQTGTGLIYPRGDVDVWLTETPAGPGDSLAIAVRGVAGLNLDVRVQTTTGRELGRFKVGGDASAPTRITPGGEGCCLIQIREAAGRAANPRDRYALSVSP